MPELETSPVQTAEAPPAPPDDPRLGQRLGKYEIRRRLGQGGMGVVYEAEDTLLKRKVALKFLPHAVSADAPTWQRFLLEAQAAARLNHPNAVAVYEIDQRDGASYLAMEYVDGGSAQDRLKAAGPFAWPQATHVIAEVCRGLAAAHAAGLIHRDIKPANVLLQNSTADERRWTQMKEDQVEDDSASSICVHPRSSAVPLLPKLADFGLAKAADASLSSITGSNSAVGTPSYMSPEQCQCEPVDARSDLYALGATYYALLTGRPPYGKGTPLEVMFAHCSRPAPDPREVCADVPAACAAVVQKAMAKEPAERYQAAEEMLHALEEVLALPGADALPPRKRPSTIVTTDTLPLPAREQSAAPASATGPAPAWRKAPLAVAGTLLGAAIGLIAFFQPVMKAESPAAFAPQAVSAAGDRVRESLLPVAPPAQPPERPAPKPPKKPPSEAASRPQRNPRVLFVLPPAIVAYHEYYPVRRMLEELGAEVQIASASLQPISPEPAGAGSPVVPDLELDRVRTRDFDALVLGGGKAVGEYAGDSRGAREVRRIIVEMCQDKKVVATFGPATGLLAKAGVLRGVEVTAPPFLLPKLREEGAVVVAQPLVVSGRIITGREANPAMFARAVARELGLREWP